MSKAEVIKRGIIYKNDGLFGFAAWPSVAKLNDGRIAVVFSGDRIKHVCPFGKTMICYSYDEGESWTAPSAVANTVFDDRDGGITVKGNQVLVTSFNNNFAFQKHENENMPAGAVKDIINKYISLYENASQDEVGSFVWVSEDGGNTFKTHYKMPITAPHGPIVLSDGRYFYVGRSFSVEKKFRSENDNTEYLPEGIYYSFSSDGYNWTQPELLGTEVPENEMWCEPHAVEHKNGEISVFIRVHEKNNFKIPMRTIVTTSSGNLTEWSKPVELGLQASPPHLMRHSSGAVVCVIGRREKPFAEQVIISDDDGKTWSLPFDLDNSSVSPDLGYPASVELKDGNILTVYYQHEKENEKNYIKYTLWKLV